MIRYYSVSQVCTLLSVSRSTVIRWIKSEQLPATRFTDKGHWKVSEADLERFAAARSTAGGAEREPDRD